MGILKKIFSRAAMVLAFFSVLLSFPGSSVALAADSTLRLQEEKIKAGLLYNFLKYTEWPAFKFPEPDTQLRVCLVGASHLVEALAPIQGRTAQQRRIDIVNMTRFGRIEDCHLIYIDSSETASIATIKKDVGASPVLLVSDARGFASEGGMVEFSRASDRRVHLHINNEALQAVNLHVGEQLLKLAEAD